MAFELDYVPIPDSVVKIVEEAWRAQIKDASGKVLWNF
jgi:phosphate transport system substrate-binding protein